MSAIVIHSPPPTERSRLLPSTPTQKTLDRSAPLKDSISQTRFIIVCTGIWSANFVFAFQSSAIPTLAPSISSGFNHAELSSYLGSVFSLASAAVIPIFGVLMDSLGRKFAMDTACFFFGVGTVLCACSRNIYWLIAARAFAGLGGGGLLTVSSVIVTDLVPLRDRGFYQGIMMTIFGSGSVVGGPLAGWLTDRYGWPLSFWVQARDSSHKYFFARLILGWHQLPVVVFCFIIVTLFLPPSIIPPTHQSLASGLASLDWLGSLLLLGSVTTLILGFSFHTSYLEPWSAPIVWGMLLAAGLSMITFVLFEIKVAARPIVPMSILKSQHRGAVMASGFFLSIGNQAFSYQMPAYFSVIVNTSTAQSGLILSVCGGVGLAMGSMLVGQHIRRGGAYRVLGVLSVAPAVVASLVAAAWKPDWPWWAYYATYFPASLGYSVFLCCQLIAMISAVDSKRMPQATALLYTLRTLGGTLGVSVGGSIQLGVLTSNLRHSFHNIDNSEDVRDLSSIESPHEARLASLILSPGQIITAVLHSKSAIRMLPLDLQTRALNAYASSLSTVWIVCSGLFVITLISACFMQEKELPGKVTSGVKSTGDGAVESGFGEGLRAATIEGDTRA